MIKFVEQEVSELYARTGAFVAFGQQQFDQAAKPGVQYANIMNGVYAPVDTAKSFAEELGALCRLARERALERLGKKGLIKHHLNNYECYYTGEIEDAVEALAPYGINEDEVREVYEDTKGAYDAW